MHGKYGFLCSTQLRMLLRFFIPIGPLAHPWGVDERVLPACTEYEIVLSRSQIFISIIWYMLAKKLDSV